MDEQTPLTPDAETEAQQPTSEQQPEPTPPPGASAAPPPFSTPTFAVTPPPTPFPPVPEKRKKRFGWAEFFGGLIVGVGCLPLLGFLVFLPLAASLGDGGLAPGPAKPSVALIDVTGVITSGSSVSGPFAETNAGALTIVEQLEKARKSKNIKAIVLWIDSPGGSAAGSDVIYREILKVKADNKPVVAAMGDVAASGGYYIASAADHVFANGATLTGSIGVIFQLPNYSNPRGWIAKSGYDVVTITSGKFKDLGNPFRPMTGEEKAYIQGMVNSIYGQFLNAVSKGRNMPMAKLRPLADGRVYTGTDAKARGLIDEIGTLNEAIAYAGEKTDLGPTPRVHRYSTSPWDFLLAESKLNLNPDQVSRLLEKRLRGPLLMDPRFCPLTEDLNVGKALPAR